MAVLPYTQLQEGVRLLLEGRRQPRTTERFPLQLSAVRDPRLEASVRVGWRTSGH